MATAPERLAPAGDAADGEDRKRLRRARSLLSRRLHLRSNDFEATLALGIVERALATAPHPDGPWRWQHRLSPRPSIRAARRRAARRRARNRRLRTIHAAGARSRTH